MSRCPGVGVVRAATEVVVDDSVVREEGKGKGRVLRVGVVCGGPSAERGISLNSARSVIDHIQVSTVIWKEMSGVFYVALWGPVSLLGKWFVDNILELDILTN